MSSNSQVINRGINELLTRGRTSVPHYAFQTLSQAALVELDIEVKRRGSHGSRWVEVVRVPRAGQALRARQEAKHHRQAA